MTRLFAILTLALAAPALGDGRLNAALADWHAIQATGTDDYKFVRYPYYPPEGFHDIDWKAALSLALISASLEQNLNRQLPYPIADGVGRVDLRGLGWDSNDLIAVLKAEKYPYSHLENPVHIRADWLIDKLAEAATYETLLAGRDNRPKNREDWLKLLQVDVKKATDNKLNFGLIEGRSGVAVQSGASGHRYRILENFDAGSVGYAWGTRDFLKIEPGNSPLEKPDLKGLKHDGEEWIIGVPKSWYPDLIYGIASQGRGAAQVYFLSAGDGSSVVEAPAALVEDHSRFRGLSSIRTPGSCINCHVQGLNAPTENALAEWLKAGVELKAKDYEAQIEVERFHFGGVEKEIERANEDFAAAIEAACGCKPAEAVKAWSAAIDFYRADVTLEVAAMEHGCAPDELRNAIAYASEAGIEVPGPVAALAHGFTMGRPTWEGYYLTVAAYLAAWRKA